MVHCRFDLRGPRVLQELWLRSITFANMTRLPSRRCVVDEMDADVFHRFIVSLGTRRAAWRRMQGCHCVARELK